VPRRARTRGRRPRPSSPLAGCGVAGQDQLLIAVDLISFHFVQCARATRHKPGTRPHHCWRVESPRPRNPTGLAWRIVKVRLG
jgi:hypothetical protein